MQLFNRSVFTTFVSALLTVVAGTVAHADDTEIFFNQSTNTHVNPNVLLILDTSGSMDDNVTSREAFVVSTTYSGSCDDNYYYYASGSNAPTVCDSTNRVLKTAFKCDDASGNLASGSVQQYTSRFIRWGQFNTGGRGMMGGGSPTNGWRSNMGVTNGEEVECLNDAGVHGDGVNATNLWPSNSNSAGTTNGVWVSNSGNSWWGSNTGGLYTFYSANKVNYFLSVTSVTQSKIRVMQEAISTLLGSVTNINVGVMRYDVFASGGMVLAPIDDIATNGSVITNLVNSWAASGSTPLSETMFEAYRYFSGGDVNYGTDSYTTTCTDWDTDGDGSEHCDDWDVTLEPSVAGSRAGNSATATAYNSPMDYSCQKNYIIYLTDGMPTSDTGASDDIQDLPNFSSVAGSCDAGTGSGICLGALAEYMNKQDMRSDVADTQTVTSYFIGFGTDFTGDAGNFAYLQDAGTRGGGGAYAADSYEGLLSVFAQILPPVLDTQTSFTAPAVAVNAFNRSQTLDDLYVSVFKPVTNYHWPGNVKKYKVVDGEVADANGVAAVDSTNGFFKSTAQSYWSAAVDGYDVTKGGAAENLPNPGNGATDRKVYTFLGTGTGDLLPLTDASVTATVLTLGGTDPSRDDLINWAMGQDVADEHPLPNGDGQTTDTRHVVGDPVHSQPAVVIYGTGTHDTIVYTATNDGYIHAIDASNGVEKWSYIPQELLPDLKNLYADAYSTTKHYGLDGSVRVLKYDIDGDGIIENNASGPDDRVIIYFGTGRNAGLSRYYALDVTDPSDPQYLWSIGSSVLPGLGQAWSTPVTARISINGATQNSQKLVVVLGGGYDPVEDSYAFVSADSVGNRVYFVDALYGTLLWSAGPSSSGADFEHARMTHSIVAPVPTIDTDGDGYADRMYLGDMAGQVWRFDIINGEDAADLVRGGVKASLGTKEDTTHTAADTRRFYSAPDISVVERSGGDPYINIAIGSGYRGHPTDDETQDRVYAIRDYSPFYALEQTDYDAMDDAGTLVLDGSLVDVTSTLTPTIAADSPGWKMLLNQHGGWNGEKVLVPTRTFDGKVFVTTYTPNTQTVGSGDPCVTLGSGTNRVYVIDAVDGRPGLDADDDGTLELGDRSVDLAQGGIAPETSFLFPEDDDNCVADCEPAGNEDPVICLSGVEVLAVCSTLDRRIKTFWRETSAE